jgi:hypothetical protein
MAGSEGPGGEFRATVGRRGLTAVARIRSIKPDLFASEKLGRCSVFARYLLVGLISRSDDYGRSRAATRLIRSEVFPYDDAVTVADVDDGLRELYEVGTVRFYEVNGSRYLELPGWSAHQTVQHPTRARAMPEPVGEERISPWVQQALPLASEDPPASGSEGAGGPKTVLGTFDNAAVDVPGVHTEKRPQTTAFMNGSGAAHEPLMTDREREGERDREETASRPEPLDAVPDTSTASKTPKPSKRSKRSIDEIWGTRPDVEALIEQLRDAIVAKGHTAPREWRSVDWHDEMRRLLDIDLKGDPRKVERVEYVIGWVHRPTYNFWSKNIRSAPKLREKWEDLVAAIRDERERSMSQRPRSQAEAAERAARTRSRLQHGADQEPQIEKGTVT